MFSFVTLYVKMLFLAEMLVNEKLLIDTFIGMKTINQHKEVSVRASKCRHCNIGNMQQGTEI